MSRWFLVTFILTAMVFLFGPALTLQSSAALIEGRYVHPADMGVEVLLNSPNLTYDLEDFERMVEEGVMNLYQDQGQDVIEGGAFGEQPPAKYLMRSRYDERLGVVIEEVNNTGHLLSFGIDHPLEGLSISIVIPGEKELVEVNVSTYSLEIERVKSDLTAMKGDLEEIGFSVVQEIDMGSNRKVFNFELGPSKFWMTFTPSVDDGYHDVDIGAEVIDAYIGEGFEEAISSLFSLVGQDIEEWEQADVVDSTMMVYLLEPSEVLDPEEINWQEAMRSQLHWMVGEGLIEGLTSEEIETISDLSTMGHRGYLRRVIYHHFTDSWSTYESTDLPPVWLSFGDFEEFPGSSFPTAKRDTPGKDNNLIARVLLISAVSISAILLGSLIFYRSKRAVDINNARRRLIYETIRAKPGIHFRAIMDELDLKPGVTSYHINKLEKKELIKSYQDGMYRKFFIYEEKVELKISLSDLQSLIVDVIKEEPGISQIDISKTIGKSKVVVNYHVRFLRDLGLLELERDGRTTHCFLTSLGTDFT